MIRMLNESFLKSLQDTFQTDLKLSGLQIHLTEANIIYFLSLYIALLLKNLLFFETTRSNEEVNQRACKINNST